MDGAAAVRTIEAKFTFAAASSEILRAALEAVCTPDASHPDDTVHSVYFDTPGRFHLAEKVHSDYRKTKVRLRWYSPPPGTGPDDAVPAFLEVKGKEGVVRDKRRVPVAVPSRHLAEGAEDFDALIEIGRLASECGLVAVGALFPMIAVRYRRRRFVEPSCPARVALDTGIRYSRVNPRFFPATEPRTLTAGVLEVKSATGLLPPSFLGVRPFLNHKDSFSKYEECWRLHADAFYRRDFQWMHFAR